MIDKRENWIDLLKSFSIFLVIILHTCNYGMENPSYSLFIYYFGVFAIPLFFMVSGYLQGDKQRTYLYCLKKILKIFLITLIWNIPLCFISLILKHKVHELFISTLLCFVQKSYYPQCWFLGSLCIIYFLLPLIQQCINRKNVLFMVSICFLINLLNIYLASKGFPIIKDLIIQTFRLWTWVTYYSIGLLIRKENFDFKTKYIYIYINFSKCSIYA